MKKMLFLSLVVALFSENVWADCEEGHQCWKCGSSSSDCYADFNPETGHLEITGNGKMTSYPWSSVKSSIISANINGVQNIAGHAFHWAALQEVTIGDSVTSIESCAFNSAPIKEIVIPSSVQSIGDYTFWANTIGKVYCPSHLDCKTNQWAKSYTSYEKVGDYYALNGKMYRSLDNMLKGIEMKRIYTVSEAEDALGKNNKNTFSIRYR